MLIGNRKISTEVVKALVSNIKKKKELKSVSDDFVVENLQKYLASEAKAISFLSGKFSVKSSRYKEIVKGVRSQLRRAHGLFGSGDVALRQELFKQGKYVEILKTHSSTKERMGFYADLYVKLWKITGKPNRILDLGCGLNPFSISLMGLSKVKYFAYDVNEDEMRLVKKFLVKERIEGKAVVKDVRKVERWEEKADVCFLWKMTDVLESGKGHKKSEEVMKRILAKYLVVSFPTVTKSGKPMNFPRRKWIELMCTRLGWKFKVISEKNELFYVITKE